MTKREGVYIFCTASALILLVFAIINVYICWQLSVEVSNAIFKTLICELLLSVMFIVASGVSVLLWKTDDEDDDTDGSV